MYWYQYLSLAALGFCLAACLLYFFRLVRAGMPKDLSKKSGNIARAEMYSFTTAMSPMHKESAYLHLPTYIGGILFHIGTFASLLLFVVFFFIEPSAVPTIVLYLLAALLAVSGLSGIVLLVKRMTAAKLRALSSPDDYLSNILTTAFQLATVLFLMASTNFALLYYLVAALLFLYIPAGKLRHVVYFFAARYHLGFFYGWRGSWPPTK